jgi:hypothetical protein
VSLTDGKDTMKVLVTGEGNVVRVDDGKVLAHDIGSACCFDSPVVAGDTVVFGHGGLSAVQFIMKSRDQVGFRRLWAQRGGSHGVLNAGGAIAVDGRVFFCWYPSKADSVYASLLEPGVVSLMPLAGVAEGWKTMVAHDLADGRRVVQLTALRKGGNQYSTASASDKHIYQIDGDHIFQPIEPKAPMDMVVITREEKPLRLANNPVDRTYGGGVIEGDRIYMRGYQWITCVGYTGEDGKRYEARTVARNLLDEVYPERPTERPVRVATMAERSTINSYKYGDARCIYYAPLTCLLTSGYAPHRWWILGPLPTGLAEKALAATGAPGKPLVGDETVAVDGKQFGWGPLYQEFLKVPGFKSWELDPHNFTDIHRVRRVVDLAPVLRGQGDSVIFLMTDLESSQEQTMRFEQTLPGVRAWLAGQEISHGDRIRFGKGVCQLILEVRIDKAAETGPLVSPRFWASEDVNQEVAGWTAAVKRRLPYFEEAVRLAPESVEAVAAKRLMVGIKGE